MRRTRKACRRLYECGSIAVEAAIIIPVLLIFLGLPSIYLAFYFLQYMAAQKAVHDAALYLSTAPRAEITTTGLNGDFAALALARRIVAREMDGVVPGGVSVEPAIYCTYRVAAGTPTKPCTITYTRDVSHTLVRLDVSIGFNYINPLTGGETALLIAPYASVRYLGN